MTRAEELKLARREERVLNWVNRIREKMGRKPIMKLKRGYAGDPQRCPLAQSLGGRLTIRGLESTWSVVVHEPGRLLPRHFRLYVDDFVSDFDEGRYHHLEKED